MYFYHPNLVLSPKKKTGEYSWQKPVINSIFIEIKDYSWTSKCLEWEPSQK